MNPSRLSISVNIGVPQRLEFTVIGAAANEVARLEDLTKQYRRPVLASAEMHVVIVEGLVNLDQIRADMVDLIALPLKAHNGDGAPVRAIALEEVAD